ncbi:MAG: hypothetical protein GY858_09660 [Candidatus Omnitrophica bacterium]|nr:hypothetical protein [Candidatus Omnitrophota bacterium]
MGVYLYRINEDFVHKSAITGRKFENEWMKLEEDGTVTINGTYKGGYCWDGCSPKGKVFDVCLGTPEAVLNAETGVSKTYHASLVHDVFYQFTKELRAIVKRKEVDQEFYSILKKNNFRSAKLYYGFVRALGWKSWYRK